MEPFLSVRCHLGEGPLWHPTERALFWTDIERGDLHRWDAASGRHMSWRVCRQLGGFTFQSDGSLLLFCERGTVLTLREGRVEPFAAVTGEDPAGRFNDVSADPDGGVFCGTMPCEGRLGKLYRLTPDGVFEVVADEVGCSNGLGFSPDGRTMYFVESPLRRVDAFDYVDGRASNRRVLADFSDLPGVPDGLTVDSEGFLWIAFWDGSRVLRLAPDGTRAREVPTPAKKPTSIAIGGPDGRTANVTSFGGSEPAADDPLGGRLFTFDAGVHGLAERLSSVRLKG
ncbi:MAG: SMP-30/gluconolactonase/LRE family protein [Fimbriimonadales bacterium]|nr:SMP-30/gluconolactonase/LRE family protein [Fimbriimonadales bacterium]